MTNEPGTSKDDHPPNDVGGIPPNTSSELDVSNVEKHWGLTMRRPSVQRKHAQHARYMPSRTLVGLNEETKHERHGRTNALLYATMRAHREPVSPTEDRAMNIASRMELDDELMHDDPISELLRIEKLRDMPQCLTVKRTIKARLTTSVSENKKKRKPISFWKRLKYKISMSFTKIGMAMREVASTMELWYHSIKAIEGHFGSGVATYFKFLRWLFISNTICCVLSLGFIVLPQSLLEAYSDTAFSGWDLLTGTGFFTDSIMYYGFYSNGTVSKGSYLTYSIPSAYFMTLLCCYIFTFLLLSIKVARSYRKNFIETAGGLTNLYASKIFCGWDFGIASYKAANLRSATIYGELKELLGEAQKQSHKGCVIKTYVLLIQVAVTVLVITIMSSTGVLLWKLLTQYTVDYSQTVFTLLVPLSITTVMNLYPAFFSWLAQYEGYASKRTTLYVTMIRTYIMEVVIVGVLLAFWLSHSTENCWQTAFTQEIYRLIIIDFIISIVLIFMAQMIRSKIYILGWKKIGAPRFDIARNTLNLTYNQTLFWIAFYFSPPMSFVILAKLILIFYIKKYGVLNHCEPPSRSWRAAQTQTLFLALAFLSMVGVLTVLGYIVTNIKSQDCGPFQDYEYTWQMVVLGVLQLRNDSQFWVVVTGLAKPGIGAAILIAMCVAVYYLRAKACARKEMVEILRGMLVLEAQDKEFLLNGISRVTEEQWLYHLNPLLTPRPSLLTNPQQEHVGGTPARHRRYSKLNYHARKSSISSINYQESNNALHKSLSSDAFRESIGNRNDQYLELTQRPSTVSDASSIHDSIKSRDANEGIARQYDFF
ncbi:transmembrane channel-like protein 5 isoform X1 [Neodiprion lecontei]|uniref:Transmembrane channel-like protein 5 isoform X1 n=2 Tax=Neodiprion lecontei TaxID=441921 RepID=A0A6J0B501_NEOLC|nr:transmembrane channel-like protein 5 isoform X1 [Neodiprion lecontei]